MPLELKILQRNAYLEVLVSGKFDRQDAANAFPEVLTTCRLTGLSKVIIDFRAVQGTAGTIEKIVYVLEIEKHYLKYLSSGGQALQIAYVGKAPLITAYQPESAVAESSGLPFRLFHDMNEALAWLELDTAQEP